MTVAERSRKFSRKLRAKLYGNFDCLTDIMALHDQRALYFAVPKVANSSIKATLLKGVTAFREDLPPGADPESEEFEFHDSSFRAKLRHDRLLLCKHQVRKYKGYLRFAFVRNPWDRLVSCYTQKIASRELTREEASKRGTTRALVDAGLFQEGMSFGQFVRAVAQIPDERANRHFRSQFSFLTDRHGESMVDRFGRFENLSADFAQIMDELGLPEVRLPHKKPTKRRDYRDYYDAELRELVSRRYRQDIDAFEYEF